MGALQTLDPTSLDAADLRRAAGFLPRPYMGQVATRCFIPTGRSTTAFEIYSRTGHFMRENVEAIQFVFPGYWVGAQNGPTDGSENFQTTAGTIRASLEKPDGTIIRSTFGSAQTGALPANTPYVFSDVIPASLNWGDLIRCRQYRQEPGGVLYMGPNVPLAGDQNTYGATTTDLTGGGTAAAAGTSVGCAPCAIIGLTARGAILLSGDSGTFGQADVTADGSGDQGRTARSIGGQYAYINLGVGSDYASNAATKYTNRLMLAQYCSHAIVQYGANDILNSSATAANVQSSVQTLIALIKAQVKSGICDVTTLPPWSTSTDGFVTTANQTTNAKNNIRVAYNNLVRSGAIAGARFPLEISDAVETARDSGIWKAPGYTTDGLHEKIMGALAEAMAGGINPARYAWAGR